MQVYVPAIEHKSEDIETFYDNTEAVLTDSYCYNTFNDKLGNQVVNSKTAAEKISIHPLRNFSSFLSIVTFCPNIFVNFSLTL